MGNKEPFIKKEPRKITFVIADPTAFSTSVFCFDALAEMASRKLVVFETFQETEEEFFRRACFKDPEFDADGFWFESRLDYPSRQKLMAEDLYEYFPSFYPYYQLKNHAWCGQADVAYFDDIEWMFRLDPRLATPDEVFDLLRCFAIAAESPVVVAWKKRKLPSGKSPKETMTYLRNYLLDAVGPDNLCEVYYLGINKRADGVELLRIGDKPERVASFDFHELFFGKRE